MHRLKFVLVGILFGIMFVKAEIISWFRIHEMFHFESFHMYGVIGSSVVLAAIITRMFKRGATDVEGNPIRFADKDRQWSRVILGGTLFGMGWALTGACPGPMVTLVGAGYLPILVAVAAALLGTYVYGVLRSRLPH